MKKLSEQLVRFDNISATVPFVYVDNKAPAMASHCAAIAADPALGTELVSDDFPVFH